MGTDIFIYIITGVVTVGAMIVFLVPLLLWKPGTRQRRRQRPARQGRWTPRASGRPVAQETIASFVVSPPTFTEHRSSGLSPARGVVVGRPERNTASGLLRRIWEGLSSLSLRSDSGASATQAAGHEKPFWRRKRDLLRGIRAQRDLRETARDPYVDPGPSVSKPVSFTRGNRPTSVLGFAASVAAEGAQPEVPAPPHPESPEEAMPNLPVMEEQMSQPEPSPIEQSPVPRMPETGLDASAEFAEMVQEWASSVGKLLEDLPAGMEASDWTPPDAEVVSPDETHVGVGATEPTEGAGSPLISPEADSDDDAAHLTLSLPEIDVQDLLDEVQRLMDDL